jgi:hypothetical protein
LRELTNASRLLNFTAGSGVSIGHIEALQDRHVQYWLYGFQRLDNARRHQNWHDLETVKDFSDLGRGFSSFLENEPSDKPLTYALDFYRASNSTRSSSAEIAFIASYSALEILVHHVLREQAKWSKDLLTRSKFADKARAGAAFIRLSSDPFEHAERLKKKPRNTNEDAFTALSEARNSIVHAEKTFRLTGLELLEMWQLSQWLVEVFIFHLVGYKGLMADRRRITGWRGEGIGRVPIN